MAKMLASVSEDIEEGGYYLDQYSNLLLWGFTNTLSKFLNIKKYERHAITIELDYYWVEQCRNKDAE